MPASRFHPDTKHRDRPGQVPVGAIRLHEFPAVAPTFRVHSLAGVPTGAAQEKCLKICHSSRIS